MHIMDKGGRRKIHKGTIPSMGGAIMFLACLVAILLWMPQGFSHEPWSFITTALVLMALIGIRDDMVPVSAKVKLCVQIVAASLLVFLANVQLTSLYGLFGIYELNYWVSVIGSILFIVFVTNAFNLIDGVDGLAGTIAFLAFSFLSLWNYWVGNMEEAIYLVCFVGALLGFLYYNWRPASIFMGDTGSLVLGMLLAVASINFINANGNLSNFSPYKFHAVLSAGVVLVLVPVFDTARVFILRIMNGHSPFVADKKHTHHAILRKGYTHAGVVRVIVFFYLLLAIPVLFISWQNLLPDWSLLLILLGVLLVIDRYLYYLLSHLHKN